MRPSPPRATTPISRGTGPLAEGLRPRPHDGRRVWDLLLRERGGARNVPRDGARANDSRRVRSNRCSTRGLRRAVLALARARPVRPGGGRCGGVGWRAPRAARVRPFDGSRTLETLLIVARCWWTSRSEAVTTSAVRRV